MPDFDPTSIDLTAYPFTGTYDYPSYGALAEALAAQLGLPSGVSLSAAPKGASWASWAVAKGKQLPEKRSLGVRMRVLGIVPHKRLGEALAVSYVALDGEEIIAGSEDHAFKPPRPAALAFVRGGELTPIDDAIRAAIALVAAPPAKKGKAAKAAGQPADAAASSKKAAKPTKAAGRFVIDTPISGLAASATMLATSHAGPKAILWSLDGEARHALTAGGGGMVTVRRPAFSPDGSKVATGASDVRVFDVASGQELTRLEMPKKSTVESVHWAPDGLYVSVLAPKDLVLLRFDAGARERVGEWKFTRAPGMVGQPTPGGGAVHFGRDADLARLDVASGKLIEIPMGGRLEGIAYPIGVMPDGLWVADDAGRVLVLEPQSGAVRRELKLGAMPTYVTPAADGSGWAAALSGEVAGEVDEAAWLAPDGRVLARWALPEIAGLGAHLDALREAGKDKDSRRYLDYTDRKTVMGIALAGDLVAVATTWSISVHRRDGTLTSVTRF